MPTPIRKHYDQISEHPIIYLRLQVAHVALRYGVRYHSIGFWVIAGTILLLICLGGSFNYMKTAAEPTYGPAPDFLLVDGGADLSKADTPGLSTTKDMFWASVVVLVCVGVTDYAWILAIAAALYVAVEGYITNIHPMISAMRGMADPAPKVQGERAAQRAQRRRGKRVS